MTDWVRYLAGEVVGFSKVTEGQHRGKTVVQVLVDGRGKLDMGDEVAIFVPPGRLDDQS